MNISELLPCPFCGATSKGWKDTNYRAFCPQCNCTTPWVASMDRAVEAWNRRSGAEVPHCPFCGGQSRLQRDHGGRNDRRIICIDCGCATSWSRRGAPPVEETWNRRV